MSNTPDRLTIEGDKEELRVAVEGLEVICQTTSRIEKMYKKAIRETEEDRLRFWRSIRKKYKIPYNYLIHIDDVNGVIRAAKEGTVEEVALRHELNDLNEWDGPKVQEAGE